MRNDEVSTLHYEKANFARRSRLSENAGLPRIGKTDAFIKGRLIVHIMKTDDRLVLENAVLLRIPCLIFCHVNDFHDNLIFVSKDNC